MLAPVLHERRARQSTSNVSVLAVRSLAGAEELTSPVSVPVSLPQSATRVPHLRSD